MNLMDLFIKVGVDDQASSKIGKITGAVGNGLATAAKVGTAAIGAAAAGVAALTKASIDGYAEYEQLVGGVETLFKDSAGKLIGYAENAYKAQGISANQYMSLATSFSASLLQSLEGDTEAAVEATNLAITDMSDNANKMGTDMGMIQNAYQGFAKANYTMLDNLKLGYGGTKEEMERLIADASELSDTVDAQDMSFANIVEAIHVVQTEMGITGTTAKEAASTIQGSVGMMKAAWANLMTGIADENADLDMLIRQFVESVGTVAQNIIPKIGVALNGASKLIRDLIPVIVQEIPKLIYDNLPILAEAAVGIIQSLVDGISNNLDMLVGTVFGLVEYLANNFVTMLPKIVQLGLDLIVSLANGIAQSIPTLIPTIVDVILQIVDTFTNPDTLASLVDAAIAIIMGLADGLITALPRLIEKLPIIIDNLIVGLTDNLPKLIEMGIDLTIKISEGMIKAIPQLVAKLPQIMSSIIKGYANYYTKFMDVGKKFVSSIGEGFTSMMSGAKNWGKDLIDNFIAGIKQTWEDLKGCVADVAQSIRDFLGFSEPKKGPLSNFHTYAPDMMRLFAKGIKDNEDIVTDQIADSFDFGEQTVGFGANIRRSSSYTPMSCGNTFGDVIINVDGARYTDERSLATAIAEALQNLTDRRKAVYA